MKEEMNTKEPKENIGTISLSWSTKWLFKHDTDVRNYKEKNWNCIKKLNFPVAKPTIKQNKGK